MSYSTEALFLWTHCAIVSQLTPIVRWAVAGIQFHKNSLEGFSSFIMGATIDIASLL